MSVASATSLVEVLRECRLLEPAQLEELGRTVQPQSAGSRELARELMQRGWLTPYQINQLFQGHGLDLVLGSYLLLERLGEGAMGQVFKARHQGLDRVVALKIIRKDQLSHPEVIRRFYIEIQAVARLSHPNIVTAYDADQVNGTYFYVMEYVEGTNLGRLIKESGPLPVDHACDYIRQAALGLQHAHERGLVHRDIKPSNLLVTMTDKQSVKSAAEGYVEWGQALWGGQAPLVKVLDMGLARLQLPDDRADTSETLTRTGILMGTPDFIAPEQVINAHTADIRADLYSLGCTFYYLLTGKVPFPGGTVMEKLFRHRLEEPKRVELLRPEVHEEVGATVRRLMAKAPENRYQTPAEVAAALTNVLRMNGMGALSPTLVAPASEYTLPDGGRSGASVTQTARPAATVRSGGGKGMPTALEPQRLRHQAEERRWRLQVTAGGLVLVGSLVLFGSLLARQYRQAEAPRGNGESEAGEATPQAALNAVLARAEDPQADPEDLRHGLLQLRMQFPGTPQARRAVDLLMQLPAPLDRCQPGKIAESERYPWQPRELAAVLGEHRLHHWGPLLSVACRADGKLLAAGGEDHVIRFWDPATGRERTALRGHHGPVTALAFGPDGKTLASGSWDGTVKLWDVAGQKERATLNINHGGVRCLAYTNDGNTLAVGTDDRSVALWDPNSNKERTVLKGHGGHICSVAFAPDGQTLAASSQTGGIKLWDVGTGRERTTLKGHSGQVFCVAFAPDGRTLASGSQDKSARLWDVASGKDRKTLTGHGDQVYPVAFAPDGRTLASGSQDKTARLWDVASGKERKTLTGHTAPVFALAFTPSGQALITAGANGQLIQWDTVSGKRLWEGQLPGTVRGLACAADGRHLALANANGTIYLLRLAPAPASPR